MNKAPLDFATATAKLKPSETFSSKTSSIAPNALVVVFSSPPFTSRPNTFPDVVPIVNVFPFASTNAAQASVTEQLTMFRKPGIFRNELVCGNSVAVAVVVVDDDDDFCGKKNSIAVAINENRSSLSVLIFPL